jgi:predicted dehydrogenase
VRAVKRILEEKRLGQPYAVVVNCFWNRNARYYEGSDWKGKRALDGGTLFTQFSHFVDILYYLLGDVEDVRGVVANVAHAGQIEFEDSGFFQFRLKSGVIGTFNYTTAAFEKNMEGSITIFGEKGTVKIGGQYLNTIDYQVPAWPELSDLPPSAPANDYGSYQGSMSNHDKVIDNVIETLRGRQAIMANALEGMKVVEIIERMYRSAR